MVQGFAADWTDEPARIHYYKWDLRNSQQIDHAQFSGSDGHKRLSLEQVSKHAHLPLALIASTSHDLSLFDLEKKSVVSRFTGHRYETKFALLAPNMKHVAAVDIRNMIWIWHVDDTSLPRFRIAVAPKVIRADFADNQHIVVVTEMDIRTYKISEPNPLKIVDLAVNLQTNAFVPESLLYSADRSYFLATTSNTGDLVAVSASTGAVMWQYDFGLADVPAGFGNISLQPSGIAISPNGACAVAGVDRGFMVFEMKTGRLISQHQRLASSDYYQFSPDGRYLVSGGGCDIDVYSVPNICR